MGALYQFVQGCGRLSAADELRRDRCPVCGGVVQAERINFSREQRGWQSHAALAKAQEQLARVQRYVERLRLKHALAVNQDGPQSIAARDAAQRLQAARTEAFEAQAEVEACGEELDAVRGKDCVRSQRRLAR
jgi:hypothetical protein